MDHPVMILDAIPEDVILDFSKWWLGEYAKFVEDVGEKAAANVFGEAENQRIGLFVWSEAAKKYKSKGTATCPV